jgi:7,8-dihydropterin-6-yl-methyl-4-(beta-D-ribofuranosyl)aminobenzene 5'-phosphate synthase
MSPTSETNEISFPILGTLGVFLLVPIVAFFLNSCASTSPANLGSSSPQEPRVTMLYDAFGKANGMTKDWGFAALVEAGGKRILFDTGDNPDIFAANVKAAGIDLTRLDFVVMSHRHGDHMGGLTHLLSVNPKVKIYAPKEGFGVYGFDLPSKFYRKDDALPADMRYYGGQPPEIMHFGTAFPGANIELVDKTTEVAPGMTLIALVSDAPGTKELKELSLAINTPDGVVLVVGCSHPGIEAIVAEAAKINPRIHLIAGGFHLVVASDDAIGKVATSLHDKWHVEWIAPGHCTGEPTFAALQKAFGAHYLYAGLGTVLRLGATPTASVDGHTILAMDAADLNSYRVLLASSDDAPDSITEPTRLAKVE